MDSKSAQPPYLQAHLKTARPSYIAHIMGEVVISRKPHTLLKQTFHKEERLCSKKQIAELFEKGTSFTEFPFRIVWLELNEESPYPAKVVISVPKKKFRNAVDRNRIRRQIKEAYRLNKSLLYEKLQRSGKRIAFMIIYNAPDPVEFSSIRDKIIVSLHRLAKAGESA